MGKAAAFTARGAAAGWHCGSIATRPQGAAVSGGMVRLAIRRTMLTTTIGCFVEWSFGYA
ncbi:hypothetical protein BVG79_p1000151 (plasmid) [Ketogulonicigenium robustum]|uniref:Uncharacterized protein n=1 Tax=Ketogulonicigenium robustum TaxID=92947 RepID=A0A1W6P3H1_9RHOB|nr:hypothetical protein BVG79_p1000151 [Ketogulonicigenium robustum]